MRLALYQPDIPQNTGTILRMAACLGVGVDVIEPAGFDLTDRSLKRAGMDYLSHVDLVRHIDWMAFERQRIAKGVRLVVGSTHAAVDLPDAEFRVDDIILMGRESAGLPEAVHAAADLRVRIPLVAGLRSLNIAVAAAMLLGEALRQTESFPSTATSRGS